MNTKELIQRFIANPNSMHKGAGKLAERYNLTKEEIYQAKQEAREFLHSNQVSINEKVLKLEEVVVNMNLDNGLRESTVVTNYNPKDIDELIKLHKVDTDRFRVRNYYSKQKGDKFYHTLFSVAKTVDTMQPDDVLRILDGYKSTYIPVKEKSFINEKFDRPSCAIINITDFHIDKKSIFNEDSFEQKVKDYNTLLDKLLHRAYHSNNLEEICFIVGSDFLHTDNYQNSTTRLTPQDVSTDWYTAFTEGFNVYVNSINKLKQFCNKLTVILVAGNHSFTKESYLAFALSKYFENDKSIVFDINPDHRKVFVYGNTMTGFHHGNCKQEQLPLIFAKEFPKEFGNARYHNIITGDKHFFSEKDISGVIVKQIPAISNADRWHNSSNYHLAEQSAICIIYDKEYGRSMDIHVKL